VSALKADYYELLGVRRDADAETIRTAFHTAARDVHPDISSEPDAERRFRDLAEAYSVLSKPASRLLYDRFGYRGRGNTGFDEALWDARRQRAPRGESIHVGIELRSFEATEGASRLVRYSAARTCEACEGRGMTGEPDPDCHSCGGTGRRSRIADLGAAPSLRIEECPWCGGEVCPECGGSGREFVERRLKVRIPAGIEDGAQLRIGGEGDVGERGAAPGDLLLDVRVPPGPRDLRVVRYLAFALFLAAIGLLVAYVLLQ
jgi:molecular chaperone DnaJ